MTDVATIEAPTATEENLAGSETLTPPDTGTAEGTHGETALDPTNMDTAPPQPVPTAEPSFQQRSLGGKFLALGADIKLHWILMMRQVGKADVSVKPVDRMVDRVTKDADGNDVTTKVKETVNEREIKWTWGPAEQWGDPQKSLTAALVAQAEAAKKFREQGFDVKERTKDEYGVWYVTDPKGEREGVRYSLAIGDRKPVVVKEKKVKEPKPPKEPKAKAEPGEKKGRAKKVVSAEGAATAPDPTPAVSTDDIQIAE